MPEHQHLFVYGTLLRVFARDHARILRAHCRFLGEGGFEGRLFDVGSYPAAVARPKTGGNVRGELYRVIRPHLLFPILDRFEGCGGQDKEPTLYRREAIEIRLDTGRKLRAWVYLYNRDTDRLHPISHGDYAAYCGSDRKLARR
jgi:gamma-glutamylcyclotransferase (GGCT)/AIG2-like uncharacterized protein YtfP